MTFASMLDPSPLAASLDRWIDWSRLTRNVNDGTLHAVCVIATSLGSEEPVGFVATRQRLPVGQNGAVRYVNARLTGEHVRASATIPMLFPTVEVSTPRAARGHYADGETRLNSPIKPAPHLGADRVVLIGLEPFAIQSPRPRLDERPSLADVAAHVLDGLLVDPVGNDLRRLAAINSFYVEDASRGPAPSARAYRMARGRDPYRPISYALVSPARRGEIGRAAERVFQRRYGGLRAWRGIDFAVIAAALESGSRSRGELLSFLLFDEEFVTELLSMGASDARRCLRRHPRFWCRDAAHDLSPSGFDPAPTHEADALAEFRARRQL